MEENVTRLSYQNKEIILIATAHVSKESVALVKTVVEREKPDSICVELDEQRYRNMQNPKAWEDMDIVKVIKEKRTGFLLANLVLGAYQRRVARKLSTNVGQEMQQGIDCAKETGAHLVLADRNIQVTFLRIWRKLGLWEKAKLLFSLIFSFTADEEITDDDLNKLLEGDTLEAALSGMRKEFPQIGDILISERDHYLAWNIQNAPGNKVVAVLGGAHVPGVTAHLPTPQDVGEIGEVPPKKATGKIIGWLIPALFLGLIVYGFINGAETGWQQLTAWVLWTGVLSAAATALALGHPLTILTSLVAAPITTLNPLLASGWFAGLTEAALRKPTVRDLSSIPEDILSIKGFFHNRFLRILLVVVLSNLGSSAGTLIAGMDMIRNLF